MSPPVGILERRLDFPELPEKRRCDGYICYGLRCKPDPTIMAFVYEMDNNRTTDVAGILRCPRSLYAEYIEIDTPLAKAAPTYS
jgi:hypothetical protein